MFRILPESAQWEHVAIFPGVNRQGLSSKLKNAWSPNCTPPYASIPITGRIVPLPFTVFPYLPHALISQVFLIHSHGQFSFFLVTCIYVYVYKIGSAKKMYIHFNERKLYVVC